MGGTSSTEQQSQTSLKINHPKFKQIKILNQNDIIRSTITTEHESDYQLWQSKLNKTVNIDDQVILLPKAYQLIRKAICGSACTIQIDYDNYPYILVDELNNRRTVQRYFSEPEIWYLLYSLVTAAHDFQKLNERIGDVRPQNIFINEEGHVKVSNLFSWPGETSNYVKTVYDHQRTYLSPEQAESAREGRNESYIDKFKAQTFSIGLTVLQTALLRDLDYLYFQNNGFDAKSFEKLIKQWWAFTYKSVDESNGQTTQKQYSDILKLVLTQMCELKPDDRFFADEVYNWLRSYHEQINELKFFTPGLPPMKNKEKYMSLLNKKQAPVNATQLPRDNRQFEYQYFKSYANTYSPNFQAPLPPPQRPNTINQANFNGNTGNTGNIYGTKPVYVSPSFQPQQPQQQFNSTNTTNKFVTTNETQQFFDKKPQFYPPPQNNIQYSAYTPNPAYYNPNPPIQTTNTFTPSSQFVLNQPPVGTQPNTTSYNNFSESQARSNDFLRLIDEKLNKLRQETK